MGARTKGFMTSPHTYQLHIHLSRSNNITIGKLGTFRFPAGHYIYTGSAKRNFEARIQRHLTKHKTVYWHIDYLLVHPKVRIENVERSTKPECRLHQHTPGEIIVAGFGAGDCRSGCGSHLKYLGR